MVYCVFIHVMPGNSDLVLTQSSWHYCH